MSRSQALASGLYVGTVRHRRHRPVGNEFRYRTCHVLLDLDELQELDRRVVGFGHNRAAVTSLHDVDHLGPARLPLREKLARWLASQDVALPDGPVRLLTGLRVLGYGFNPVSWWFCHHADGRLALVVAEVTNTFGDSYSYLLDDLDVRADGTVRARARKVFHVSPFQPIEGGYSFRFDITPERVGIWIEYGRGNGGLIATMTGRRRVLNNRAILWSLLRRPLGSRRVLALIHWQALKLWWRGARYRPRPEPPLDEVTR